MNVLEAVNKLTAKHEGRDVTMVSFNQVFGGCTVAYTLSGTNFAGAPYAEERMIFFDKDGHPRFDMLCS